MQLTKKSFSDFRLYPERILQFGEGNFLRGFVDWMIHEINKKADFNGSVVVVQPIERGMVNVLNEQDGLYTLYLKGIKDGQAVRNHEVINSISRGINPYENYDEFLKTSQNPDMRFIISNTTESGITFDETDEFAYQPPKSFPAKIAVWLYHRFLFFKGDVKKGVHVIPCELIEKNATILKGVVLKLAEKWNLGNGFSQWIEQACTFNNTLVDRIVPGFPKEQINEITQELGYEDKIVVDGEQFHLWVIEGSEQLQKELPLTKAGLNVIFTKDLTPYRTRKVRILNGAHTTLVPPAYLFGLETVREAVEDSVVGKFVKDAVYQEIVPTLDLPKAELEQFAEEVINRFKNPFIKHFLMSISLNSWSKFETRVLPSILEYKKRKGTIPTRLAFSLAATIAFYKGKRGQETIALNDDATILDLFKNLWAKCDGSQEAIKQLVTEVLGYEKNWKFNLNTVEGLNEEVTKHLISIEKNGIKTCLTNLV